MKRIAILHIGPPKTGSTSIQKAIAGHDDGSTFTATFERPNHSMAIRAAFRGDLPETRREQKEQFRAEFSAMLERRDRDRILVSGEGIWGMDGADKAEMVEFIHRRDWEVCVVAYVREPASFAASCLSHYIRHFRLPNTPDGLNRLFDPRYRRGLSAFRELLPPERLHVRPFDLILLEGGTPVSDFCKTIGLDLPGAETIHANKGLSLPAIKLLLRFKKTEIMDRYDSELVAERRLFARTVRKKYAGPATLDPALCEGIADWSETDWLYENFGIDFRRNAPPGSTKADLEAVLDDLDGVDLSGLDECLAEYGITGENFPTAEQKLHRLSYVSLTKKETLGKGAFLFRNPGRNLAKSFHYRALKRLSKSRLLSPSRREALARRARELFKEWVK